MAESERSSIFGTPGGRHRRQLVFSERILGSAPLRAAVTVFAVVVAGLTTPMLQASADETTPPAVASVSYLVTFAAGTSAADQAAVLADAGAVDVDAIPQLRMHAVSLPGATASSVADTLRALPSVTNVNLDRERVAEGTPDDPSYADQWALPKIGWDTARSAVTPAGSAVVAVLDTGVDGSHADLAGQLVNGYSALTGGDPLVDPNGHGTAMAGIVAADTNNGVGIAGVGYRGVKVMPVTVLSADGTGHDSDVIAGVVWAADHGADVILMSFSNPGYSPALQAALDYAWSAGAVLVAATGNDSSSEATFPAGSTGVVGVSATNESDSLSSSSNYGADTFLAAPGVGIVTDAVGGGITSVTGTSASAAVVAGAAGVLAAADASAGPGVIVGRLARNADAAGTADQTGNGRLNLGRAVADTGTDVVRPAGAAPIAGGGPLVGPYVAADKTLTITIVGSGSVSWSGKAQNGTDLSGSCTSTCSVQVGNSSTGSFSAVPNAGQSFLGWTALSFPGGGSTTCAGTTPSCTYAMSNSDSGLTANFTAAVQQPQSITFVQPTTPRALGDTFSVNPTASSGLTVTVVASGGCTAAPGSPGYTVTMTSASMTCVLTASQAGSANFLPAADVVRTVVTGKASQSITFVQPTTPRVFGGTFSVNPTASSGLAVSVVASGGCTVVAGSPGYDVTITSGTTDCVLTASQAGNANFLPAADVVRTVVTGKASQSITFVQPTTPRVFGGTFSVNPTASSGLAVSVVASGGCTVVAGSPGYDVTITSGTADCVLTASQAGNANFLPAPDVARTVVVGKAAQSITFVQPTTPRVFGGTFSVNPTASSGLAVSVVASGGCTVVAGSPGYTVTITSGTADCVLTASQAGNANFLPAPDVARTVVVGKAAQSITFVQPTTPRVFGGTFSVNPTASSGLAVSVVASGGCTVVAGSPGYDVTITSGTTDCVLTASQAGNANFLPAPDVARTVVVGKAAQSITFVQPTTPRVFGDTFSVNPTASSGLAVSVVASGGCTVVAGSPGYDVTITSGTTNCVLTASQAGNANYAAAPNLARTVVTNKKALSVDAVVDSKIYGSDDPAFSWTYSGFTTGENVGNVTITGAADCSRTSGESVAGSPYTITCAPGDLDAANYRFVTGATADFVIHKKALSVDAVVDSKIYGSDDPAFSWTYSGFTTGENVGNVTITGAADCSRTSGESVAGSPYTITCAPGDLDAANYRFVTGATADFVIHKKALSVDAVVDSKIYGSDDPAFSWTYSGFTTGENVGNVTITGAADCSRTSGESVAGSPYTITCAPGDLDAANYRFVTGATADFVIHKKALSVDAVVDSKIYGSDDPAFSWTYSGFTTGENVGNVTITGAADCSRTSGESVAGSPYTITCAPGDLDAANYRFVTGATADFVIHKKALSVDAVVDSKIYGSDDPAFSWTYSGFTTGENVGNVTITGAADCSRTSGESVAGSPYTITCAPGDLDAANYRFVTGATADFVIHKAETETDTDAASSTYSEQSVDVVLSATVINISSPADVNAGSVTFQVKNGAANVGSAVTDSTLVAGAASVTYALPAGTAVGDYTIVATYNGTANFADSSDATKKLTVGQRATVTAATAASSTYSEQSVNVTLTADVSATASTVNAGSVTFQVKNGAANVGSAVTDSTLVAGAASVTYALPAGTAVGDYTIVATYNGTANFADSSDATKKLTVGQRATVTAATAASSTYSEQSVNVTLTADVSATASTVNAGSVTFQVKNGAANVGSAVTDSTLVAGAASVTYALPAGTAVGDYTIVATYNGTANFADSSDATKKLTVGQRATVTAATAASSTYSEQSVNVTLTADVSATASTVNAGSVTFQVKNGAANVGSAVTDSTLVAGAASVTYALPAGTAVGDYTIVATYNGTANFADSSDATKKLTVGQRATVTAATAASSTYSEQSVNVTLTADVSATASTVNAGSVTFQVKNGAANVGSAVTDSTLVAGAASVTYALPAGTAVGDYTIVATYNGTANFADSSDATKKLTVGQRATVVTTPFASMVLGTGSVGLSATVGAVPVASSTVNAGTVTFQLKNGATNIGSAVTSAAVASGAVSVVYALPTGTPVGSYTIVATYNGTGNFLPSNTATAAVQVVYRWDGFLQPINDTAHTGLYESKFKLGQTIPAKFEIKDAAGNVVQQLSNPTFGRSDYRGDCDTAVVTETVPAISADTIAEYKLTGGQYLYGWSTKSITKAGEYRIYANLADGTSRYVDICLTR